MSDEVTRGIIALVDADRLVDDLEAQLSAANKALYELRTVTLPMIFADADAMEQTVGGEGPYAGAKAKVGTMITGSLPRVDEKNDTTPEMVAAKEARRSAAIAWLVENGCEALIKCDVVVKYDKGDADKARKLAADIQRQDNSAHVIVKEDIHPQTLQAEVRRRLLAGKAVPVETLGIVALPAVSLTKKPIAK